MDKIVLEAKVQEWGDKCAEYSLKNGKENPDYLFQYGKWLFEVAKQSSSLVDTQKMEEKQLPLDNPKVKIANFEEQIYEPEGEGEGEVEDGIEGKAGEPEEPNGEAEEEEEDDFVAAFQVVDLARVLYEKETITEELETKLAKSRELLGDISLEDDNPSQAVEDYTAAIELKRKIYGEKSGQVSEAEFMLSLAFDALENQAQSLEHLKLAAEAAKAAGLPSAEQLFQKAHELELDLKASAASDGAEVQQARDTTKESITGRSAIASAVQSLVANANDITQLARKRKRNDQPQTDPESASVSNSEKSSTRSGMTAEKTSKCDK